MLQFGLYARKSHDDRKLTEKSIGEQNEECRSLARREDLRIVWVGEESKSAMTPRRRPVYTRLIGLVREGQIDAIICWHVNRLVRNMEEGGELIQLMIDGKLKEIRTPHATYRSCESIWPVVIEAATATQSSIDNRRNVKRAMDGNFKAGGWNHKVPPGYLNARDRLNLKKGRVEKDPLRFPLIRKAWDLYLRGDVTIQDVCTQLDRWGYTVQETLNLRERPISYISVYAMLRNPFYAGFVHEKGALVEGRHSPMVTPEEFRKVQELLSGRSFTAKRRHYHEYAGLMRCAYCGQQITGEWKRIRNGSLWHVYHCSDTYERCTQKGMAADKVDAQFRQLLKELNFDPRALKLAADLIRRSLEAQHTAFAVRSRAQKSKLSSIDSKLARLADMWISGMLTDSERYQSLERNLLEAKRQTLLDLGSSGEDIETGRINLERALTLVTEGSARFESNIPGRKRTIISALGSCRFFGREKQIKFQLRPVLRELSEFTNLISTALEPRETGAQKQNRAVQGEQLWFGGRKASGLEPPDSLIAALGSDLIELGLDESPAALHRLGLSPDENQLASAS